MKPNVGKLDATLRITVAVIVVALYFFKVISGGLAITLLVIAVIFALTAYIKICPLYSLFGINTCPISPSKK
jgi:hypothetical protein